MYSEELTGIVKRIYVDKGFGFIEDDESQTYFFHVYEVSRTQSLSSAEIFDRLKTGDKVRFFKEIIDEYTDRSGKVHTNGLRAVRVRPC
jgi:cold shock CspA family protein